MDDSTPIRGYVLDKERLKNGAFFSKEYFESLCKSPGKSGDSWLSVMEYRSFDTIHDTYIINESYYHPKVLMSALMPVF
jgi:hypothetical protein